MTHKVIDSLLDVILSLRKHRNSGSVGIAESSQCENIFRCLMNEPSPFKPPLYYTFFAVDDNYEIIFDVEDLKSARTILPSATIIRNEAGI